MATILVANQPSAELICVCEKQGLRRRSLRRLRQRRLRCLRQGALLLVYLKV